MDQSYSESDVSLSPSHILDRLQVLRQLQLLQRGKLQKHRLQYENSPEITSSLTEIVSNFSNSTSYNTFRSLLQSSQETTNEMSPCLNASNSYKKENLQNVIEGVSVLNLSEESEFIANSVSPRSLASARSVNENEKSPQNTTSENLPKKQISLDEMPILTPKKDFEMLIEEKLKIEKVVPKEAQVRGLYNVKGKRPFLKRGEGTARFGLKKNNLVIQNTKSLPWKKKKGKFNTKKEYNVNNTSKQKNELPNNNNNVAIQILEKCIDVPTQKSSLKETSNKFENRRSKSTTNDTEQILNTFDNIPLKSNQPNINHLPKVNHAVGKRGNTWASVLTKEQDDFLRQLKQSDYYKNFVSPAKSTISDTSCNENIFKLRHERETVEQKMFELIENKVSHDSFNINSSFFNQFLRNSNAECSGESTPLVMQKCLYKNPNLMHIYPNLAIRKRNENSCSDTCNSECTECSENCSTVSSCCSCETITQGNKSISCIKDGHNTEKVATKTGQISKTNYEGDKEKDKSQNDISTSENDVMNSNMAEMNAKLIATSDLLKDRLRELEDEIETFRKENANLTKMREEVDMERQKFYEEKMTFEQKFNEEKILSEYYLAEEKEKLSKQKQMYERYVRDMRGRLNKKEKDEITNLKKEIHDLKDEIRVKDAKSTSIIARLRNQMKILEKDKKNLEDEMEKLKKENSHIKHNNDITRRLTNLKYLEQVNKKLTNMTSKESKSEVDLDSNIKYKAFEIERQSRVRKKQPVTKGTLKPRAKSVPNLHVTSRYAKYFSQKDSVSNRDKIITLNDDNDCIYSYSIDNELTDSDRKSNDNNSEQSDNNSENEEENNLEKIYNERFKSISPTTLPKNTQLQSKNTQPKNSRHSKGTTDYLIEKSEKFPCELQLENHEFASRNSWSPSIPSSNKLSNSSKSPMNFWTENLNQASELHIDLSSRNKSPVSILSNRSTSSFKSGMGINQEICSDNMIPSPEPTSSKSNLSKTNLNPTEIKKPDGTRELRFPNGNIKFISADGTHSKFIYYNGDIKENFYNEGRIKYYYAETKTFHTTHPDGLEVLEFPDGQIEKRYKDGSSEIRLPNGSVRYYDPKNEHVREEWRFPDGTALTVSANGEQRIVFANGQIEVHAKDHKRREFPDGSVKLVYNDGTAETRYASGRVRIKDKHGNLIMDSAP